MRKYFAALIAGGALIIASEAAALPLIFAFDADDDSQDLSFRLNSDPTPDAFVPGGGFRIEDVGVTTLAGVTRSNLRFFTDAFGGGFEVTPFPDDFPPSVLAFGPSVFTGPADDPTFSRGTFDLVAPPNSPFSDGTLTITASAPGALGLFCLGLLVVAVRGLRSGKKSLGASSG